MAKPKSKSPASTKRTPKQTFSHMESRDFDLHARGPLVKAAVEKPKPRNQTQAAALESIDKNILTILEGPAGTGKTFLAAATAAHMYLNREIERIIVTRPAVEAGEELGFLPGEVEDKIAPWFAPFRIELEKRMGKGVVECGLKNGRIQFLPLAHMRGWTLENAFVVLDEAQNTTPTQMKLFLTRLGENVKVVVDGDREQSDIAPAPNGLREVSRILSSLPQVGRVEFSEDDIVRSDFMKSIIKAYRKA